MSQDIINTLGVIAAIVLPVWNIPLIVRVVKRRSSQDISLWWALGVWTCFALMFPSGLNTQDVVWKTFNIVNLIFFSGVVAVVLYYRKGCRGVADERHE